MQVMQAVRFVPLLLGLIVLASSFDVGQSDCQNSSLVARGIPCHVNVSVEQLCDVVPGLSQQQSDFCEENRDLMTSIMQGAHLAMQECQYQFRYRRWNCSVPERGNNTLFHLLKGRGSREAAFTYAIASAAVTHSIARACVQSNVSTCGCSLDAGRSKNLESDFRWGGCGDNIEAGAKFARKFMNAGEDYRTEHKALTLMNLHNIEAGIQVVRENSLLQCKCHGIDPDCAIKTCWRQLAKFRDIGKILFDNYEHAVRMSRSVKGTAPKILVPDERDGHPLRRPASGIMGHPRPSRRPTNSSLIYLKRSPNYCVENEKRGSLGTVGRFCNRDSAGHGGCVSLCCGRGYRKVRVAVQVKCNCKFVWCCAVKCDECTSYKIRYVCR